MSNTAKRRTRKGKPKPARKARVAAGCPPMGHPEALLTHGNTLTAAAAADPGAFGAAPYVTPLSGALTTLAASITAANGG